MVCVVFHLGLLEDSVTKGVYLQAEKCQPEKVTKIAMDVSCKVMSAF